MRVFYRTLLRIYLFLTSFLSAPLIRFFSRVIGWVLYISKNDQKKITSSNLSVVFGYNNKKLNELTFDSLVHSSASLLESGLVWRNMPYANNLNIEVEGFKEIQNSLKKNKGLILFTPHHGNIEVVLNFLGRNTDCMVPYTKVKNPELEQIVLSAREDMGVKMVKSDLSGVKAMLKFLKEGKTIAIASDQVPEKSGGIMSPFFSKEVFTMTLVARLVGKIKCPVHSVVCLRNDNMNGYKLFFSTAIGGMENDINSGVNIMNRELEKCIMRAPGQYAWEYKIFKKSNLKGIYK